MKEAKHLDKTTTKTKNDSYIMRQILDMNSRMSDQEEEREREYTQVVAILSVDSVSKQYVINTAKSTPLCETGHSTRNIVKCETRTEKERERMKFTYTNNNKNNNTTTHKHIIFIFKYKYYTNTNDK